MILESNLNVFGLIVIILLLVKYNLRHSLIYSEKRNFLRRILTDRNNRIHLKYNYFKCKYMCYISVFLCVQRLFVSDVESDNTYNFVELGLN
jgi:hypothetical protein